METSGNKNTRLKITIDILAGLSVIFLIVQVILGTHYYPDMSSRTPDGGISTFVILLLINFFPVLFSIIWLIFRYSYIFARIGKKYPFTGSWFFIIFLAIALAVLLKAKW